MTALVLGGADRGRVAVLLVALPFLRGAAGDDDLRRRGRPRPRSSGCC